MNPGKPGNNVPGDSASTILVVDDSTENLTVLGELLRSHYRVRVANSGEKALKAAASAPRPDLILLDVMMPGMDGHEVLRRLAAGEDTRNIPVIFVTAMDGTEDEESGLALGAVDYIVKPINPAIVLARVRTQLELKGARDRLANQNEWLEKEIAERMKENLLIHALSVRALACLAEARDNETGQHIVRTQTYVGILAHYLSDHQRFREALAGDRLDMLIRAAPLHDIGKVGIPDMILLKPGKLTAEEFGIMKTHTTIGAEAISRAMSQTLAGVEVSTAGQAGKAFILLQLAQEISFTHHEKWDGSGYPSGRATNAIPVAGRLMALADVFDALTNKRVYKEALGIEEATSIICQARGTHFDPDVVDAFLACKTQFIRIAERYSDSRQLGGS